MMSLAIAWALQLMAAQAPVVLSFTVPTYSAMGPHDCTEDTWNPKRDVDSAFVWGTRQSWVWVYTVAPALAASHSRAESTEVLRMWWGSVKEGADPVLLRAKDERGREGAMDTIGVPRSDYLMYTLRTKDRTGNVSCGARVKP